MKTAELSELQWLEILSRLKYYATSLTKGTVMQGASTDADDLVQSAVFKWLKRGFPWDETKGPATVPAVVRYLVPAVKRLFLDRLKRTAAKHEVPPVDDDAEDLPVSQEVPLLREHLNDLVTRLRPFLKEDPLAELYLDLQVRTDEFLSDEKAAREIADDITGDDIRNMKKRLGRHVRDMYRASQANEKANIQ